VLGYIDPDYFLGGRIKLDEERASEAIRTHVGDALGLAPEQAAYAILAVANEHMVSAIRDITINEGVDPREAMIVAGGGACGLAVARIAEELGTHRILVPRTAAALSACGGQFSDVVTEFSISRRADTNRFDAEHVNEGLAELEGRLDEFFDRLGTSEAARRKEFFVEARYPYQVWELEVPLRQGRVESEAAVAALVDDFHAVHERVFAVKEPGQYVECLYWKGRGTASLAKPELHLLEPNGHGNGNGPDSRRPTWMSADAAVDTPVYLGASMGAGMRVDGPAIVEEPTTTIVVPDGWTATVGALGGYLLERG
jgi:N-methylhydantoinase A